MFFARKAAARLLLAACLLPCGAPAAGQVPGGVATLLRASGLPLSSFGIDVHPVEGDGAPPLVSLNAERPFLLASTTKLVTSLAALRLLGPDHRWTTHAGAAAPLVGARLSGDLVISGGAVGLTAAELRRWFTQLRAEGVDEIGGNIVLDRVALLHERDPAQAPTTSGERATDLPLGTTPEARVYNAGKLLVSVQPGAGEVAEVRVKPLPVNVVVVNEVLMGGGCSAWARWRSATEAKGGTPLQLWVRGRWEKDCGREDIAWVAPPPAARYGPELGAAPALPIPAPRLVAELWAEAGGKLRGRVVEAHEAPPARRADRFSSEIATPLAEVLREMNKTSNNSAAQSVLLSLGAGAMPGAAMLQAAQARVQDWLRGQGLGDGDLSVVIGSGQSRAERGRPRALVQLLRAAWRGEGSQAFVDSLPIAGVDGTLVHRMRSGAATGQAFLKTGTLSDTRALAGYVRAKSGKVYAVTTIVTHPQAAKGTPALDALIEWIAREG